MGGEVGVYGQHKESSHKYISTSAVKWFWRAFGDARLLLVAQMEGQGLVLLSDLVGVGLLSP